MHSAQIENLLTFVRKQYGSFQYYGSTPMEEHGTCFKVPGILATFSVHTQDGALAETYDVQVEGIPPGSYVYACEVSLPDLMVLISKYEQHEEKWP